MDEWEGVYEKWNNFLLFLNAEWKSPIISGLLNDNFRNEKMRVVMMAFLNSMNLLKSNLILIDQYEKISEQILDDAEEIWDNYLDGTEVKFCPLYFLLISSYMSILLKTLFNEQFNLLEETNSNRIIENFISKFKSKESFIKFFRYIEYFLNFVLIKISN